jgi:TolB-like protein/Flp pilus assembly protein TadD
MTSFFTELRRRHVFKVAAAYVVTGWVVAQAAEFLLESFGAPQWVLQTLIILLVLGFPIALVLAWAFELTPAGLERDHAPAAAREPVPAAAVALPPTPPESPGQSIAVLPFVDMSADRDQEYFSDGLSEELLNLLAKVPGLHVASRTSAFSFKGKQEDIRTIAEKLRVRHVLEGSVRKAGNHLRVTAQLIKAEDGYHLWSENYDRPLDNIFAMQDEIALAVVDALKVTLMGEAPTVRETSTEAYNLYLQGIHFFKLRSPDSLNRAVELLEKAVEIDPSYAPAWSWLSGAYAVRGGSGSFIGWERSVEASRAAVQRALELDPEEYNSWISLGQLKSYYDWDWAGAQSDLERARELAPNASEVYEGLARLSRTHGRLEESIAHCDRAIELDPLNWTAHSDRARALMYQGRLDEAEAGFRNLIHLNPTHRNGISMIARIELLRGNVDSALAYNARVDLPFWTEFSRLLILYGARRDASCENDLAAFCDEFGHEAGFQIAEIYALGGETDLAFEWLERAISQRDPGLTDELLVTDTLRGLHSDPRWEPLVERMGLLDSYRSMPPLG